MVSLFKIPLVDATIAYMPEDKDKKWAHHTDDSGELGRYLRIVLLFSLLNDSSYEHDKYYTQKKIIQTFLQELCSLKKALGVPYNRLSQNACIFPEGQGQAALGPQGMGSEAISQSLGGQQEGHSLLP